MSDPVVEPELCKCPTPKTRKLREENQNVCPDCSKMLVELGPDYSSIPPLEDIKGAKTDVKVGEVIEKHSNGEAVFGSVKDRPPHNAGVKLKPPSFTGKSDPQHFFVKLLNYLETYKIQAEDQKIRVLKSCLEDSALDLYLSLDEDTQSDLGVLEKTFREHFKPLGHSVIETEAFMKMKKTPKQSVSEFHTSLKKKANELLIDESLVRVAFIQGLEPEFQRHCFLQKADTLQEYLQAARDFEKIAKIGSTPNSMAMMTSRGGDGLTLSQAQKLDAVFDMLSKQQPNSFGNFN